MPKTDIIFENSNYILRIFWEFLQPLYSYFRGDQIQLKIWVNILEFPSFLSKGVCDPILE